MGPRWKTRGAGPRSDSSLSLSRGWYAVVLFSQNTRWIPWEEGMVSRRAAEMSGSLQESQRWLDSVSRKATFSESNLRSKEQNDGQGRNMFLEHLWQVSVGDGVPKLWEDCEGFDSCGHCRDTLFCIRHCYFGLTLRLLSSRRHGLLLYPFRKNRKVVIRWHTEKTHTCGLLVLAFKAINTRIIWKKQQLSGKQWAIMKKKKKKTLNNI